MHLGKNLVHFVQCKAGMSQGTEQLLSRSITALIAVPSEPGKEIRFRSVPTHTCATHVGLTQLKAFLRNYVPRYKLSLKC